ncbi:GGDEF domain-containing protein [Lysinibacillus fusiformis]|nr:GGDEF domain-containing protein [Lysinibacillus fusiformis]
MNSEHKEEPSALHLEIERLKHNLKIISMMNKINLIVLLSTFITIYTLEIVSVLQFASPLYPYSLSLVVISIYLYLLDIKKFAVTEKNYKRLKVLIYFYPAFFLNLAALLPIMNHYFYNPILLYSLIIFSYCPFLISKSKEIVPSLCISAVILFIGLMNQDGNQYLYYLQGIYLLALISIAGLVSRSIYHAYIRAQKFHLEMGQEVYQLKRLTELLNEANRQLQQEANLDPLTNLYNRRAYNNYIIELQKRLIKSTHTISVIMVDVDCFKLYNDTYGHSKGDNVLRTIGSLLHDVSVEYSCFAARFGGEEFVLIVSNEPEDVVQKICYQIQQSVYELHIQHESSTIDTVVTVSIGACTKLIEDINEINECISEADAALYFVKQNGRNSFEYKNKMHV